MNSTKYISITSGLLSLVLVINVILPAVSNCLVMADCEMMRLPSSHQNHDMNEVMNPNEMSDDHRAIETSSEHCNNMVEQQHYSIIDHELSTCLCQNSSINEFKWVILPIKTSLTVDIREAIFFDEIIVPVENEIHSFVLLEPNPSLPDLFIQFEALLI